MVPLPSSHLVESLPVAETPAVSSSTEPGHNCLSCEVFEEVVGAMGGSGLLLNEIFPLVVGGRALGVRLAVEGKLVAVLRLRGFHFLVPVRLFPAADDPGCYGQYGHSDENGNSYYP